jgi:membrane associated rhomboid family serine protease
VSSPDLFVVCKSCGAEVSPYITECPYCGNRLRKRAPKLDKPGKPAKPPKPSRGTRRAPRPRTRPERSARVGRPWGVIAIVVTSIVATVVATLSASVAEEAVVFGRATDVLGGALADEPWRAVTSLFVYASDAFQALILGAVFLFGWLLERRHGAWASVAVFLITGAAGVFAAWGYDDDVVLLGAPGAAAGLLAAWSVPHLLARRRGEEDEDVDMLGAGVFALLLVALPLAVLEAHWIQGLAGGLAGLLLGLPLARAAMR